MKIPNHRGLLIVIIMLGIFAQNCSETEAGSKENASRSMPPEWSKDANIYEVNIRQYTPEGTLNAFKRHIPRLDSMGVEIVWLMPIHPIGQKNRKGKLGSYYSIKNYRKVNPRFGTMEDFKSLVKEVHDHGMKLIMDWVPNHTAWDNPWVTEHPEFYAKDSTGAITYEADWTDIALLNYDNKTLWDKMIAAMQYWVEEANIDGFRVDHAAHEIPMAFWKEAVPKVDAKKEGLFWLAEWEGPKLHPVFDASYAWEYFHLTTAIASGKETLEAIEEYMEDEKARYPQSAYRMYFTSNHDENSWNGTDEELFGDNFENFAVMATTINGIPLIYSGQETALDQRLEFFKKDTIKWEGKEYTDFYRTLLTLKKENEALWNGQYGGDFELLETTPPDIFAYRRKKNSQEVVVILNFADKKQQVQFADDITKKTYSNVFKPDDTVTIPNDDLWLGAHQFLVLSKK